MKNKIEIRERETCYLCVVEHTSYLHGRYVEAALKMMRKHKTQLRKYDYAFLEILFSLKIKCVSLHLVRLLLV